MSVVIRGLCSGMEYKAKVAAGNVVGWSEYSLSSTGVKLEDSDDVRLWPPLRIDLVPGVPRPRTLQSSRYHAICNQVATQEEPLEDVQELIERILHSVGHGVAGNRYRCLCEAGRSTTEAAVALWIGDDTMGCSPVFVKLNRVLLADEEEQLKVWMPLIRLLTEYVGRPELAPCGSQAFTAWRGSKLTHRQVNNLCEGEVVRAPMFLAASANRHLAEVFQDFYLVQLRIPPACRNAAIVREGLGIDEVVLPPYTPLRVIEIGRDNVVRVDVLDSREYMEDVELKSSMPARCVPL